MVDHLSWRIALSEDTAQRTDIPAVILSAAPSFHHESMPDEVAMLLPTTPGPTGLIEAVVGNPGPHAGVVLGLFLAGPFLNVELESDRLLNAGVGWIANLPSVGQQDEEFSRQLRDVGLDFDRELERLVRFRDRGFRIAAVVTDGPSAAAAAAIEPEVMIVLPRVADFAAGFPSLRQRSSAAQAARDAGGSAGWSGVLLGLGETRELDSTGLWSSHLDGLVCRPVSEAPAGAR